MHHTTQKITGAYPDTGDNPQSPLQQGSSICKDQTHPEHCFFTLLLSGRQYRALDAHNSRLRSNFYPHAVALMNWWTPHLPVYSAVEKPLETVVQFNFLYVIYKSDTQIKFYWWKHVGIFAARFVSYWNIVNLGLTFCINGMKTFFVCTWNLWNYFTHTLNLCDDSIFYDSLLF